MDDKIVLLLLTVYKRKGIIEATKQHRRRDKNGNDE